MSEDEETRLLAMGQPGRNELIERHLDLVVTAAKRCANRGVELGELIAVGNLALVRYAQSYTPEEGEQFVSRLYPHLVWAMRYAVRSHGRSMRLPDSAERRLRLIRKAQELLAQQGEYRLSVLAEAVALPEEEIVAIMRADRVAQSLDAPLQRGGEGPSAEELSLADVVADNSSAEGPMADRLIVKEIGERVRAAVASLSEREQAVLALRYGREISYGQIGRLMGCSDEWSRRQGQAALAKLRDIYNVLDAWDEMPEVDDGLAAMSEQNETQEACPKCPLYRKGSKPYCARSGKTIRPEEPLPAACRSTIRTKPI